MVHDLLSRGVCARRMGPSWMAQKKSKEGAEVANHHVPTMSPLPWVHPPR
jgi:hypothetical protein